MGAKKRILVVDDEPRILNFVRINLVMARYEVITTTSGADALELAQSKRPDVMLLDILMQPLTGLDVLEKLRGISQVPVIVFTARKDIVEKALKEGAVEWIGKPFRPEELVKKVQAVLNAA